MNSYHQCAAGQKSSIADMAGDSMADGSAFLSGKRCLVIDDEFLIALDIQQTLESAGARVTCIGDADEALAALTGGTQFDVAVLDLKLSGFSRDSTSVAALLTERGVPFDFLTALRAGNELAQNFPHAPRVEKPYQVALLMDALRRALDMN
jgi:CheY-like chemotaxis protein